MHEAYDLWVGLYDNYNVSIMKMRDVSRTAEAYIMNCSKREDVRRKPGEVSDRVIRL